MDGGGQEEDGDRDEAAQADVPDGEGSVGGVLLMIHSFVWLRLIASRRNKSSLTPCKTDHLQSLSVAQALQEVPPVPADHVLLRSPRGHPLGLEPSVRREPSHNVFPTVASLVLGKDSKISPL